MEENNPTNPVPQHCTKCGHILNRGETVCPSCGTVVNKFVKTTTVADDSTPPRNVCKSDASYGGNSCPTCGRGVKASAMYCATCGSAIEKNGDSSKTKQCGICKKSIPANDRYCTACGCDTISVGLYKRKMFSLAKPKKETVFTVALIACLVCLITIFALVFTPIASIKITLLGETEKLGLSMFSNFGKDSEGLKFVVAFGLSAKTIKTATFISFFTMASLIGCVVVAVFFMRKLTRSVAIFNLIVNIVLVAASSIMLASTIQISRSVDLALIGGDMLGAEVSKYYGGIGMFVVSLLSLISSAVLLGATLDRVGDKAAIRAHRKRFIIKVIVCIIMVAYIFQMSLLLGWSTGFDELDYQLNKESNTKIAYDISNGCIWQQNADTQYKLAFSPVNSGELIEYGL